jgi:MinD superfamily P-loop ATPase
VIHEIAVLSGKGGTGKTTLTLSLIPYLDSLIIADCDVDAPDIHLILEQSKKTREPFYGIKKPFIDESRCTKCGLCQENCNYHAISETIEINHKKCEGCTVCSVVCPVQAITMVDSSIGEIFEKETMYGPLIDARLTPGEEASGKLVAEVRQKARQAALTYDKQTILIDGSPGIGCNVMSTITGVNKAILVTEPSESSFHDLKRIIHLATIVSVEIIVVINKFDHSHKYTKIIEEYCIENSITVGLKIPYDKRIFASLNNLEIPSLSDHPFFFRPEWNNFISKIKMVNI